MRLEDFIAELSRCRHGILRCGAEVAHLRVSGLHPLNDTDATLALLERAYPIEVQSITSYVTLVRAQHL